MYRMGRKFRLHHKKNMYSVKSLTVSIPRDSVRITALSACSECEEDDTAASMSTTLSLPITHYTTGIVNSLCSLHSRTQQLALLPTGMMTANHLCAYYELLYNLGWMGSHVAQVGKPAELIFCKLGVKSQGSAPSVLLSLNISNDFTWKAFFHGKELSAESALLRSFSSRLDCAGLVKQILHTLDSSRQCHGNPDGRFMALLPSRKGVLHDHSGMYHNYLVQCHVYRGSMYEIVHNL